MAGNVTKFEWDARKHVAAQLLAEEKLSDEKVAKEVGISKRQLERWKKHPDFSARVQHLVAALAKAGARRAIARRSNRVRALDARWEAMQQVIRERAEDMANVPGGKTGLLVRTTKGIGRGNTFQIIEEYAVDTGLLRELREHEKQAAQELGQWTEKKEVTGKDGQPLCELSDAKLAAIIEADTSRRSSGIAASANSPDESA